MVPTRIQRGARIRPVYIARVSLPNYRWSLNATRPKPGYPKTLKSLGDHLKVRRLDLGLTQKEAAVRLAVDPDTVRDWEIGRSSIEVRSYPAVIEFLGYNPLPKAMTPGESIRHERMTRGWSRRKLALVARVDEATVRRLEENRRSMARKSIAAVLDTLGKPECERRSTEPRAGSGNSDNIVSANSGNLESTASKLITRGKSPRGTS